jgi:putative ABC transport system permease protein
MFQDLRLACRLLWLAKGFTFVATATLALGIAATTAVFSIVNGALLRPLPYRDPGRLVEILDQALHERGNSKLFGTYADYREYARHAQTLDRAAAVTWAVKSPIMTGHGNARGVTAIAVSAGFFDLLGARAALGRTFTPTDEEGGCKVVLSHAFWTSVFSSDAHAVGESVALDGKACVIVGVTPKEFAFYPSAAQMWTLILPGDSDADKTLAICIGRLKPRVTIVQAQAELSALFAALHAGDNWRDFGPAVNPLQPELTWLAGRNLRVTLWVLLAAVGLVLLIACVNVANLLLGRALARSREFAVRAALGGGRARLFRQLLTEVLPIAAMGGALGLWMAFGAVRYFQSVNPVELPVGSDISIDPRVLLFTIVISAIAALAASTAPAWKASRADLNMALKSGGRGAIGGGALLGRAMAAMETALSVILLAGAGLLMQSVLRMDSADLGIRPEGLAAARINLPADRYRETAARWRFWESLNRSIEALPGVESAAYTSSLPPEGAGTDTLEVFGRTQDRAHLPHDVVLQWVGEHYFRAVGSPMLSGKFDPRPDATHPPEAVIDEALAEKYFPDGNAIGSRIRVGGEKNPWLTITGIVVTARRATVYNEMQWVAQPTVFRSVAEAPPMSGSIAIRTRGNGLDLERQLQNAAASIGSSAAVGKVETMREILGNHLAYPRFRALVFGGFAAFALLLAGVGLHGVLSELVSQRRQEIGVRMALGAHPTNIAWMVARQGGAPVLAGLAAGIASTLWLGRYLSSMLYAVAPGDLATLTCVSGVLLFAAAAALALPARRAARVDPMEALREVG